MGVMRGLQAASIVARANARAGERPDVYLRALWSMRGYGASPIGSVAAAVVRSPDRAAVVDDRGSLTYRQLWQRANALAAGLTAEGIEAESRVGLLAGNGAPFVEALLATALLGSTTVLLNTRFAPPQVADVAASERLDVIVSDAEYGELAGAAIGVPLLDAARCTELVAEHLGERPAPPADKGRIVLMTSGTTGRPKGAHRPPGGELEGSAAVLDRIPLRHGDTRLIAAPLFHGWGLTHLLLGLGMSATVVVQERFEPESCLRAIESRSVRVAVLVPAMLQRILELPPQILAAVDTSSLRVLACSGSALPPWVAAETLRRFGEVLYNVYGSTEVAVATIATPADLHESPDTAGRPARGAVVRVLDDEGHPVPPGEVGRIFVRNALQFEGYTSGAGKPIVDGLMASGDIGSFGRDGRLTVVGRDDDMIVSGGENVYPRDVEQLLITHPAIADVVVLGVPDSDFGAALRAWVVRRPDARVDEEAVRDFVRARLARYQVPREVVFLSELPRNAMGKVQRTQLVTA
jgi:fatty-acyl-CoA synthase